MLAVLAFHAYSSRDMLSEVTTNMPKRGLPLISQRMRELRQAAGKSQQQLATDAGLSISVVTRIEQGKNDDPRVSTIMAIAEALGTSIEALMAGARGEEDETIRAVRRR